MAAQLLETKFHIPRLRSEIVSRRALVERINTGLDRKLTLISAPAGFGKTTLLSEWASRSEYPVSWVSLDADDNNADQFWVYVITAIHRLYPHMGMPILTTLQSQRPPSSQEILTGLVNKIVATNPPPFALVLDDYHLLETPEIHRRVAFLIEHCPPFLHLMSATRSDPPFPLGRWRARGEINELRTEDLRFTFRETVEFFTSALGLEIPRDDVEALGRRTEGWIAGLQMAAISLKGILQTQDASRVSDFVDSFSGSHRFVLDYLVEEVIDLQEAHVVEFLLKTSILDRFTAQLCHSVTGVAESREILNYLDRTNMFLVPLDEERSWYRYHHLFGDLLRNLLQQRFSAQVPLLHSIASEWFEANGWITDAVHHALAIDDIDRLGRLIAGNAVYMIYVGELHTLERWLGRLPADMMCSSPWLCVAHAWIKAYLGDHDAVETLLGNAEQATSAQIESCQPGEDQRGEIRAHIAVVRGFKDYFTGAVEQATERVRKALENLSESDRVVRCYVTGLLGSLLSAQGNLEVAQRLFEQALQLGQEIGLEQLVADASTDLVSLYIAQGRFRQAVTVSNTVLELNRVHVRRFGRHLLPLGRLHYHLSTVYLNWNDLDTALHHATIGLEIAETWGKADEIAVCHSGLAWVLLARGDSQGALDAIRQAGRVAGSISPWWEKLGILSEARLQLSLGNVTEASRLARRCCLQPGDPIDYGSLTEYLCLARLLTAEDRVQEALEVIQRLRSVAESTGALKYLVPILVTEALALYALERPGQAEDVLGEALSLAEPEHWTRVFIDSGPDMAALLRRVATGRTSDEFVIALLKALDAGTESAPVDMRSDPLLPDPLTNRELEVLQLLTTPATHARIAEQLYISRNTVRSHVKRIYSKLSVNNRIQAIEKARELGLIV